MHQISQEMRLDSANGHCCRIAHRRILHHQVQPSVLEPPVVERTCADKVHALYNSFHRILQTTVCFRAQCLLVNYTVVLYQIRLSDFLTEQRNESSLTTKQAGRAVCTQRNQIFPRQIIFFADTISISCAVSLLSVLSSRASEKAGEAGNLVISCMKMSPLNSSHRRAHVSGESGSFPICCTILSLF